MHLGNLPDHDVVTRISREADGINNRFKMLNEQFSKYQEDITNYKDYLTKVVSDRE